MAVATDDDEDVEEMQGYRIGRIGSASCKEDRLDQMGSAAGTRLVGCALLQTMLQCPFLRGGEGHDRSRSAGGSDGLQARRPARAAPLRSSLMGMEAFDTAAASPSSMFGRPALFPSSGKLMESYGVASRNCVQRLIAVDLETNIWPSLNFAPLSIPPAWLPHSSDKQDIGRSQNASNSCRLVFLCTIWMDQQLPCKFFTTSSTFML
ncbi:hypothetical protein DAI22_12g093600 [Oryza sativa Japonica Group]|nr:uncharacterized protein LOC9271488 isoform X2 [Oryza sativa Japonica Group]KAF2907383.1 hypothetical protein DAI22_12g093600 [Oryza sativa Japonica Group]